MKKLMLSMAAILGLSMTAAAHEGHEGSAHDEAAEMQTIKGEVLDMACYIDHNATGEKHADCAKTCALSGLPVGLKGENGKTYLLIGEHKPANEMLAPYAGKTITVRGKVASRDGINMIENVEVVK